MHLQGKPKKKSYDSEEESDYDSEFEAKVRVRAQGVWLYPLVRNPNSMASPHKAGILAARP